MTLPQVIAIDLADKITHEQVLEMSASQLEKLTEADLMKIYGEALNVTRPEYAGKQAPGRTEQPIYIPPEKKRKLAMLQEAGVDIGFYNRKRRK